MALVESLIVFVVSLLIGAVGIYAGASLFTDVEDFTYAVVTAFIAAVIWSVVGFFLGWIPFLGPLLAFLAYLAVLQYRYPGGWFRALGIALIAWVASLAILSLLAVFQITSFKAIGVAGA